MVALLTFAANLAAAPAALADAESDFVGRINAERRDRGLRSLQVRGDLAAAAERHSARMARDGRIYHNPSLRSEVSGWTVIGENVGRGSSVGQIHRAFMSSSSHRAVILNAKYNQIGVGVTLRGGTMYVSQIFVRRGTTSTPTTSRTPRRATRAARPAVVASPRADPPRRPVREEAQTVALLVRMMRQDADLPPAPPPPERP
ncbi:MAG TPA: CAP domain-containing protein [Actinomycetota bacterium]|jgi:hypothetical protein